jgi:saccharopine dehydrogenase (NAD+, L-lysine-forming)
MLVVYGASGYTGKLISELLVRRGVTELILAGRSREKLDALLRELERVAPPNTKLPQVAAVALDDAAGMEALARRGKVLLSCAGPFARMGPPVIDACLRAGTHYLDITGEVRFMIDTRARDAEAKARKVVLANAVGYDVVPSDLVVHLAAEAAGGSPDLIELAMHAKDAKPSGGTLRSMIGIFGAPSLRLEDGSYVDEPVATRERRFQFPPEFGERTVYSAPIGDLATIPRTASTKNARTYMSLPKSAGIAAKVMSPIARVVMRGAVAGLAEKMVPPSGEGPNLEERRQGRFAFVAEATKGGRTSRASISGSDGYGLTSETAVCAALALSRADYAQSGALSPMQAVEPAEWRRVLESIGCVIDIVR